MEWKGGKMAEYKSDCGLMIKKIHDRIAKEANSDLAAQGLTLAQLMYLEYLQAGGGSPVPLRDLEKHFGTSQPTVSGLIRRLRQKRLVRVASSPEGGRAKTAELTDTGRALLSQAGASRQKMEAAVFAPLTDEERKQFQGYLERICRYLDSVKELGSGGGSNS